MSTDMLPAAALWLLVCLAATCVALRRRVIAGVQIRELLRGGFDGIPALKWLLQTMYAASVVSLLIAAVNALALDTVRGEVIGGLRIPAWTCCMALTIATIVGGFPLLRWMFRPARRMMALEASHLEINREMPEGAFLEIGASCGTGASARWEWLLSRVSIAALMSYMVVYLVVATKPGVGLLPVSVLEAVDALAAYCGAAIGAVAVLPQSVLIAIVVPAITLFVIVGSGSAVSVMPVPNRVTLQCGLAVTIAIISAAIDAGNYVSRLPSPGTLGATILATCLIVIGVRRVTEFLWAEKARQDGERRAALSETFSGCDPDLEAISRSDLLESLRREDVLARIGNALEDQERRNRLVPRLLARLMKITDVRTQPYATIQLRFLVVRRRVVLQKPKPCHEAHRHPRIDVWDENAYPIVAPQGYAAEPDHRIALPPNLDIVKACRTCGGSGTVWEEESYTDWENYTDHEGNSQLQAVTRWRSVLQTCNECSGTGSLRYRQVILTSWRAYRPVVRSSPAVSSWCMLDETPERELLVRPVLERFRSATEREVSIPVPRSVAVALHRIADVAIAMREQHAAIAGRSCSGRVYRSEIAIGVDHAVRFSFEELPGRVAWILGADRRCLFQRIPLSKSAIAAVAVLPALAVWAVVSGCDLFAWLIHYLLTGLGFI